MQKSNSAGSLVSGRWRIGEKQGCMRPIRTVEAEAGDGPGGGGEDAGARDGRSHGRRPIRKQEKYVHPLYTERKSELHTSWQTLRAASPFEPACLSGALWLCSCCAKCADEASQGVAFWPRLHHTNRSYQRTPFLEASVSLSNLIWICSLSSHVSISKDSFLAWWSSMWFTALV